MFCFQFHCIDLLVMSLAKRRKFGSLRRISIKQSLEKRIPSTSPTSNPITTHGQKTPTTQPHIENHGFSFPQKITYGTKPGAPLAPLKLPLGPRLSFPRNFLFFLSSCFFPKPFSFATCRGVSRKYQACTEL